jgi:hypothetical protein
LKNGSGWFQESMSQAKEKKLFVLAGRSGECPVRPVHIDELLQLLKCFA